jgi:HEAT repeat protein
MSAVDQDLATRLIATAEGVALASDDEICDAIASENAFIRWYAIKAAGVKRCTGSARHLIDVLSRPAAPIDDKTTDERLIAAWSLGQLGLETFEHFCDEIISSPNHLWREGLADALGETRDPKVLRHLARLIEDPSYDVVLWAALSLSKLGKIARPLLESALESTGVENTKIILRDAINKIDLAEEAPRKSY